MAINLLREVFQERWMLLFVILFVTHCFRNYYRPGIRAIPGPVMANFTNVWRFCDVWKGRADITHIKLHRKYGDYVRLGPNAVSISKLSDIKNIYGINKGYEKVSYAWSSSWEKP